MSALLTGIGIGIGIPLGIGLLFVLAFFTQDLGIWRKAPKEYRNP